MGDYKNSEYEAGDYSYRFSGNNPDNYVCLDGKSEEGPCDIAKLYRVIGAFSTDASHTTYQVKLIKSEYLTYDETEPDLNIGKNAVTESPSGWEPRVDNQDNVNGFLWSGSSSIDWNDWRKSKLNAGLNNPDGKYLQTLQKYIEAGLISDTTWYIGGNESDKISRQSNIKLAYDNELGTGRLTPQSPGRRCAAGSLKAVACTMEMLYESEKIGLMYATEYSYASEPDSWTSQLWDYNDTGNENGENNWLYNGVPMWCLSRVGFVETGNLEVAYSILAFTVMANGTVYSRGIFRPEEASGVRPVFVLLSDAELLNGEGSKANPWRIKLPE